MSNPIQTHAASNIEFGDNSRVQSLKRHYDACAARRDHWIRKNSFYHQQILTYFRFFVAPQSSILELGCGTGDLLAGLAPSVGVGVDISLNMVQKARGK